MHDLTEADSAPADRLALWGAATAAVGVLASGPLSMFIVARSHPQPPWSGARVFARYYDAIQLLPFAFGFLLIAGFVVLLAAMHALAAPKQRAASACALSFATIFAALIFFNYVVQTTFVPTLVRHYREGSEALISALTMSNPQSLGWGLEMWGYAFLGMATWLASSFFSRGGLERATRWAFIANGPISIAGAVWTVLDPGWEFTTPGMLAFALWNLLALAMASMSVVLFRARLRGHAGSVRPPARLQIYEAAHVEFAP
jgi:hypothetical protein